MLELVIGLGLYFVIMLVMLETYYFTTNETLLFQEALDDLPWYEAIWVYIIAVLLAPIGIFITDEYTRSYDDSIELAKLSDYAEYVATKYNSNHIQSEINYLERLIDKSSNDKEKALYEESLGIYIDALELKKTMRI